MTVNKGNFNLLNFIIVCLRSWRVFVLTVLVCGFLAGVFTVVSPPKKEVLTQLMIKDDVGGSSMMMAGQIARSFSLGDMFGGSSTTDNETAVIGSHAVFLATARQLNLNTDYQCHRALVLWRSMHEDVPVVLIPQPGMADTISVTVELRLHHKGGDRYAVTAKVRGKEVARLDAQSLPLSVNTPYGTFGIGKTESFDPETADDYRISFCSYDAAASAYAKKVNVFVPDRKADFIDLSYVTDCPAFGKTLLNHIIDNYVEVANKYKLDRSRQSLKLVDDRLATLSTELVQSEDAIEAFKISNQLTDLDADAQYLMTRTGSIESALLEAQTRFEVIKLTRDFINNPSNNYQLIPELFVSTSAVSGDNSPSMISQYNTLILERMNLLNTAKPTSQSVKQIDQQIDAMRENILSSINRAYENIRVTLNDLKSENSKNKNRLGEIPAIEKQYLALKRDNLLQEQIYLFLLQQREELNMNLASRTIPAQVIDAPYTLPEKAGMGRMTVLVLGVLAGLALGALYVMVFKMRRSPVATLADMQTLISAPQLQPLYLDEKASDGLTLADGDVNAQPLRRLRSQVISALEQCGGHAVTVTSMHGGEGKSYVTANLAAALALAGKRVLAIDAALRQPALARALDVKAHSASLADYVLGRSDKPAVQQVALADCQSLDAMLSTPVSANPADMLASDRFAELLAGLVAEYDYVIVDCAPAAEYSDVDTLTALTDMTVMVCRAGITTPDDAERINGLYDDSALKRLGVVINGFKS